MKQEYANYVREQSRLGYEKITEDFSRTRGKFWDELLFVRDLIPKGARIVDIGCGNGRFFGTLEDPSVDYTGIDFSEGLIRIANERYQKNQNAKFLVGDALSLPFPNNSFETTVSFAVIHHIPSQEYREQFLRELERVTKPGGIIVITAWDVWHSKPRIVVEYLFKKLWRQSSLDIGDAFLKFGKAENARFVHAFSKRELRSLVRKAGLCVERIDIVRRPSREQNFLVIAHKG